MIIHIECQAYNDAEMAERLLQYHVNIRRQFKFPVLSCVIYLLQDGNTPVSPLISTTPAEEEMIRFHFRSIQVGQLTEEDILATQQPGLDPFLLLTKVENKRQQVERMLQQRCGTGTTE